MIIYSNTFSVNLRKDTKFKNILYKKYSGSWILSNDENMDLLLGLGLTLNQAKVYLVHT